MPLTLVTERDILTAVRWIAVKFGTGIRVPLWKNCNNFDDPLIFHLATSDQNFDISLSCTLCLMLIDTNTHN